MPGAHLAFPLDLPAPVVLELLLLQAAQQAPAPTINAAGALAFFGAILGLAQTVGLPAFGMSAAWAGYQLMFSTSPRHQDGAKEQLKRKPEQRQECHRTPKGGHPRTRQRRPLRGRSEVSRGG